MSQTNVGYDDCLFSLNCECQTALSAIRHHKTSDSCADSYQICRLQFHKTALKIIALISSHSLFDVSQLAYASYFIAEYYLDGEQYDNARHYSQRAIVNFCELNGPFKNPLNATLATGDQSPEMMRVSKTINKSVLWCICVKCFWLATRIEQSAQRYGKAAEFLSTALIISQTSENKKTLAYTQLCQESIAVNQTAIQYCDNQSLAAKGDQPSLSDESSAESDHIELNGATLSSATIMTYTDNDNGNDNEHDHSVAHKAKTHLNYQLIATSDSAKHFSCHLCGRKYKTKASLRSHARIHSDAALMCDICGCKFPYQSNLTQHKRTHSKVRPFQCNVCDKAFTEKSNYKRHFRLHSGERPYKCLYCDRRFIDSSAKQDHTRRSHTNEKPYKCGQCQSAFVSFSDMKSHSVVHSNERPHKCQLCSKSFKRKSDLVKHSKLCNK